MKFKIFSMLVVLGMLSVLPLIYTGKLDLTSLINGDSLSMDKLGAGLKKLKKGLPGGAEEPVTVYKWTDKYGRMQFGNTPPPDAVGVEVMSVKQNNNIIDPIKVPPPVAKSSGSSSFEMPNPYSPGGMKKVLDDAKGIEEMLQKRHEQQQKKIRGL